MAPQRTPSLALARLAARRAFATIRRRKQRTAPAAQTAARHPRKGRTAPVPMRPPNCPALGGTPSSPHIAAMTRRRPAVLSLLAPLALAACATAAGFDARMRALVGLEEAELVRVLGIPDGEFRTPDGRRFLQYERLGVRGPVQVEPVFGLGFGYGFGGWRGTGVGVGTGLAFSPAYIHPPPGCSVTFEIAGGRVAGYTWRGGGCVAVPPPA